MYFCNGNHTNPFKFIIGIRKSNFFFFEKSEIPEILADWKKYMLILKWKFVQRDREDVNFWSQPTNTSIFEGHMEQSNVEILRTVYLFITLKN